MQPTWLLETDTFLEGNPQRLADLLAQKNIPFYWFKFSGPDLTALPSIPPQTPLIAYCSLNLAAHLARHAPWTPTLWADPHALRTSTYLAHWGQHSLQQHYAFFPLAEIRRRLPELLDSFGIDGKLFLRPNDNDKSFSGTVVSANNFERWFQQNSRCYDLDPTGLALVAPPQTILSEHRFIVADQIVITGSKYRLGDSLFDGQSALPPDLAALKFAQQLVSDSPWQPMRIYTLDIAELPTRHALLEIGSINSASLYAADLAPFIDAASRIALEDHHSRAIKNSGETPATAV